VEEGSISERYGALSWRGKWDMKLIQDYNFKIAAGKTNTIQFSVDVNLSNLLNSKWGLVQVPTSIQPIGVSVDSNTNIPTLMVLKQKRLIMTLAY
jgi:hypothetical protein